ncbi:uncharacterized protein [Physcomitrium patens]|uniref:t-SNARE coiled-coil homology domain-containing protein n=1 Tax=Physcomitrium patens TaxID=3218 RepID=A0A2K1JWD1_PHYPA|nr:uncharacterized protein LOC112288418 [Physcomitrium patens]PNR45842.1 hypothetical protein PHYPA_015613 [Physcomitrium patens]|eukprot:XP_024388336.1 uncharacterized protein LOC112288418 [Physcomitrella patens]
MAVGHCGKQSTNPFETSDSEVSYVNPFDDDDDALEVSSAHFASSASVPKEVNRGSYSCEEDGEDLIPVKVERTSDKVRHPLMEDDEALSDLSNLIGQLKNMSLLINSEISKQTEGLAHLVYDVEELNARVKGANVRGHQLRR